MGDDNVSVESSVITHVPTLVVDVDSEGSYACKEAEGMGEISVPYSHFAVTLKLF